MTHSSIGFNTSLVYVYTVQFSTRIDSCVHCLSVAVHTCTCTMSCIYLLGSWEIVFLTLQCYPQASGSTWLAATEKNRGLGAFTMKRSKVVLACWANYWKKHNTSAVMATPQPSREGGAMSTRIYNVLLPWPRLVL